MSASDAGTPSAPPVTARAQAESRDPSPGEMTLAEAVALAAEREHDLLSILELTRELTASHDPHAIANLVLLNLMGQFATPRGALWILPEESPHVPVLIGSYGIPKQWAKALGAVCAPSSFQQALARGEPLDLTAPNGALRDSDRSVVKETGITLLAPILVQDSLRGLVGLGSRVGDRPYGPGDLQILRSSLGIVGVALENTTLYNNLMEINRRLREAASELQEYDRMKSEFLRNVNHELRTPLTILTGYLEILLSDLCGPEQGKVFLGVMREQSLKLTSLLEKLLDFSQLAMSKLEIRPEDLDLAELLTRYHAERAPGIRQGLREFRLELQQPNLPSRIDPLRLTQVLNAIVDNAVKFTPQGAHICLRAGRFEEDGRSWARVDVSDDGIGIPADKIPVLMQAFRQGDGSLTRTVGGLGIGLPLSHRLVEGMGGSLRVASEVGAGSTISVLLPLA